MKQVRYLEIANATSGTWAALDELMAYQHDRGEFQETAVLMRWKPNHYSFEFGVYQDGDELDYEAIVAAGGSSGRRLALSGGTALHTPELPCLIFWYRLPPDSRQATLEAQASLNGEANAAGLRHLGFPNVQYRHIGDTEIVLNDFNYKVFASGPANVYAPDFWSNTTSIVWGAMPAGALELLNRYARIPPEKFEDKKAKSFVSRLRPLELIAADAGLPVTADDVVQAILEENVRALMGATPEPAALSAVEQAFLDRVVPFFESPVWHYRRSTRRLCAGLPDGHRVGVAAYKSRKLIKASIVVDPAGRIANALFTGDLYIRPQPTATAGGALDLLGEAIVGLPASDEPALRTAIGNAWLRHRVEAPQIEPEHFVFPVLRAAERLQSPAAYLASFQATPAGG